MSELVPPAKGEAIGSPSPDPSSSRDSTETGFEAAIVARTRKIAKRISSL